MQPTRRRDPGRRAHAHGRIRRRVQGRLRPRARRARHAGRARARRACQPAWVDHVVMGNALQTSGDAIYGARHVGLKAGVPVEVPALTVNRLCGSGIQSVVSAAQMIRLGESRLARGRRHGEHDARRRTCIRGARSGFRLGEGKLEDSLMVALLDTHCGLYMAQTSDNLARQHAITPRGRWTPTRCAARRRRRAARERGVFRDEIVPVDVPQGRKTVRVEEDDHLAARDDARGAGRASKPSFGKDGFVTAGNASGIVDGAAALVVATRDEATRRGPEAAGPHRVVGRGRRAARDHGHRSRARVAQGAARRRASSVKDMDLVEVNEAFAGQYLAVEKELGPRSRADERQRRRHRARASAGRHRHPPAAHPGARAAAPRRATTAWPPPASAAARASR